MPSVTVKYLDKYITKTDGTAKIIIQVLWTNSKREVNTGVKIQPEFWDPKNHKVKKTHPNHVDLNLLIDNKKSDVINIITEYRLRKIELTPVMFDCEIKNPAKGYDFYSFMEIQIKERHDLQIINENVRDMYQSQLHKLKDFKTHLQFAEITPEFLNNYNRFMINRGNGDSTRNKALKSLKVFVDIAIKRGLLKNNPFESYKFPKSKSNLIFLDKSEVKKLFELYDSEYYIKMMKPDWHRTLRAFLFIIQTGLRISELKRLKMEDIKSIKGNTYIYVKRSKNEEFNLIPLSNRALEMIKQASPLRVKGIVFETISEQKMNSEIKTIAKVAGIDTTKAFKLSHHKARHTFATLLISEYNADIPTVSRLLGHKKISTTLDIYTHVITGNTDKAIANFDF